MKNEELILELLKKIDADLQSFKTETRQQFDDIGTELKDFKTETRQRFDDIGTELKDFKTETRQRFDDIGTELKDFKTETRQKFEDAHESLKDFKTETRQTLGRIEQNQIREKDRLDEVYEARHKVKVTFGWQWSMMSLFIATIAVGISKIFS